MRFNPKGDYKAEFEREVNEIIEQNIEDRQERIQAIGALVDDYSLYIGEAPDPVQLERLADYILREELLDKSRTKSQTNEYPFHSERQLMRRQDGEVRFDAAWSVGTDGRNYRAQKRRKRSVYEQLFVDKAAKIRNKERQKRYREFTRPGEVVVYYLEKE